MHVCTHVSKGQLWSYLISGKNLDKQMKDKTVINLSPQMWKEIKSCVIYRNYLLEWIEE